MTSAAFVVVLYHFACWVKFSADDILKYSYFSFSENRFWHFMQTVSNGNNLHESQILFSRKNKKKYLLYAELAQKAHLLTCREVSNNGHWVWWICVYWSVEVRIKSYQLKCPVIPNLKVYIMRHNGRNQTFFFSLLFFFFFFFLIFLYGLCFS